MKIFAINLGSTSTKIAYYEDETCLLKQTIAHSLEDLQHADGIFAQYGFRRRDIEAFLAEHHIAVTDLDAIVSRGGPTAPVEGGTYRIDEDMLAEIRTGKYGIHPCSLGCQIAYDMTKGTRAAALTVDMPGTCEFDPLAFYSGLPDVPRVPAYQALNNRAMARAYAESEGQQKVIDLLVEVYRTGDLRTFDDYTIHWLRDTRSLVDFTCYFTESYGDPLGMKASWEAIVNFKDVAATARAEKLSQNAQWFEDHSPVAPQFKKEKVKGVSAKVITAAILGGDLYPSTAIGINLPNSDWVRREYGSKSVTIGNLMDAYSKAAHGSGMDKEFVIDEETRRLMADYGDLCDNLHTDLHECLGHGSGKLLPTTDPDTLKAYGSTIEEARADLFGLYYLADSKLVELGLTPNADAYKSQYYTYMMNGLMTQLVRIKPGQQIEEAHMRNRALIAHWVYEKGKADKVVELVKRKGKTFVKVNDYAALRALFGSLLAEVQRIKSEGDYDAARRLVEDYGVKVDATLHKEVLARYERLHIAPYKGFINPVYEAVRDSEGRITDVRLDYSEPYDAQMLRYSRQYATLPAIND